MLMLYCTSGPWQREAKVATRDHCPTLVHSMSPSPISALSVYFYLPVLLASFPSLFSYTNISDPQ